MNEKKNDQGEKKLFNVLTCMFQSFDDLTVFLSV